MLGTGKVVVVVVGAVLLALCEFPRRSCVGPQMQTKNGGRPKILTIKQPIEPFALQIQGVQRESSGSSILMCGRIDSERGSV